MADVNPPTGTQNAKASATVEDLKDLTADHERLNKLMDLFVGKWQDVNKLHDTFEKRQRDVDRDLKSSLRYMDDTVDKTKAILGFQKQMTAGFGSTKDQKEAENYLEYALMLSKKLEESAGKGTKLAAETVKQQKKLAEALKEVRKNGSDYNKILKDAEDNMVRSIRSMDKLAKTAKDIHLTGLNRDLAHAEKAVTALFGKTSRLAKFHDIASKGKEFKESYKAKIKEKEDNYKKSHPEHASFLEGIRAKRQEIKEKKQQDREAERSRPSLINSWIHRKAATAYAGGKDPNAIVRTGLKFAERGEGSITRGIISTGAGMAEGGAASLMEMAGPFAAVLAGLELLKQGFDKNAKINSGIDKSLGKANIYTGNTSVGDDFTNIRKNLRGQIGFTQNNKDNNLAIAQAINESGIGLNQLTGDNLISNDSMGYLKGSFGTFQRNAYDNGQAMGLDPKEATAVTLKLVTQYSQSLGATEDFFKRIKIDSDAAGISASRYIDIIDKVSDGYSKMNKNLQVTVGIIGLLSKAGQLTADSITDIATGLTKGQENRSLAETAVINQSYLGSKRNRQRINDNAQSDVDTSIKQASEMTGVPIEDIQKGLSDPKTAQGYMDFLFRHAADIKGPNDKRDSAQIQAAGGTVLELRKRYEALRNAQVNAPVNGKPNALAYSQYTLNNPTQFSGFQGNMAGLQKVADAAGVSLASIVNSPDAFKSDQKMTMLSKLFGVDMGFVDDAKIGSDANTDDIIKYVKAGKDRDPNDTHNKDMAEEVLKSLKSGYKFKPNDPKASAADQVMQYLQENGVKGEMDIQNIAQTNPNILGSLVESRTPTAVQQAVDKTQGDKNLELEKEKNRLTRTSDDIMAQAFSYLFDKLLTPLNSIDKAVAAINSFLHLGMSGGGLADTDTVSAEQSSIMTASYKSGMLNDSRKGLASKLAGDIEILANMDKKGVTGASRDEVSKRVEDQQAKLKRLGEIAQSIEDGHTDTLTEADWKLVHDEAPGYLQYKDTKVNPPSVSPNGTPTPVGKAVGTMGSTSMGKSTSSTSGPGTTIQTINNNVQATTKPNWWRRMGNSLESSLTSDIVGR